jgi:hypothetical protein
MKKDKLGTQFWTVLGTVNLLTLICPVILLHRAKSVEEDIFANLVLLGSLLLLAAVNAVSIVVAQASGADKR